MKKNKKNMLKINWGVGITLAFIAFAIFILSMVIRSYQENVDLVTSDYYQQELAYENILVATRNVEALSEKPSIRVIEKNQLVLHLPIQTEINKIKGKVHVYRPSDASSDHRVVLNLDKDDKQYFDTKNWPSGRYLVKLSWTDGTLEYYTEMPLYLD